MIGACNSKSTFTFTVDIGMGRVSWINTTDVVVATAAIIVSPAINCFLLSFQQNNRKRGGERAMFKRHTLSVPCATYCEQCVCVCRSPLSII